jgi:endonuclease III
VSSIGAGEQITRMIVGALIDTHQINGIGDVKADIHVCRVLGRALTGHNLSPGHATEITRCMYPQNPWFLDRSLFLLGQQSKICAAGIPKCDMCYLRPVCEYHEQKL